MKPSNEEIRQVYLDKKDKAAKKFTEVQAFYSAFLKAEPSEDLEYQIIHLGCKVMIANLKAHITHCNTQIKKHATVNNN